MGGSSPPLPPSFRPSLPASQKKHTLSLEPEEPQPKYNVHLLTGIITVSTSWLTYMEPVGVVKLRLIWVASVPSPSAAALAVAVDWKDRLEETHRSWALRRAILVPARARKDDILKGFLSISFDGVRSRGHAESFPVLLL